jgi:hypothetical protein
MKPKLKQIEWKGCKIEAKTIRDKDSHSLVYIAYQYKAILLTPTFQDIDFLSSNRKMDASLSSLQHQTKKRNNKARMHLKKPMVIVNISNLRMSFLQPEENDAKSDKLVLLILVWRNYTYPSNYHPICNIPLNFKICNVPYQSTNPL